VYQLRCTGKDGNRKHKFERDAASIPIFFFDFIGPASISLIYTPMAEALIQRGALVYMGWNDVVSIDYVDNATLHLLNGLIAERKTIWDAVWDTREKIGPDPNYSANLVFYPVEVGGYTVVE